MPAEYEVLYEEDVFDAHVAEKIIHGKLSAERINPKREFFKVPLKKAVKAVFETCLEVNASMSQDASTRLLITITAGYKNKTLIQQIAERLSSHKGGEVSVWILYESEKAAALLRIGDEWDVHISPVLVNELKQLRGVSGVQWVSRDLDWLERYETENRKILGNSETLDNIDDEIPF